MTWPALLLGWGIAALVFLILVYILFLAYGLQQSKRAQRQAEFRDMYRLCRCVEACHMDPTDAMEGRTCFLEWRKRVTNRPTR
jgi:hypothetical protein